MYARRAAISNSIVTKQNIIFIVMAIITTWYQFLGQRSSSFISIRESIDLLGMLRIHSSIFSISVNLLIAGQKRDSY